MGVKIPQPLSRSLHMMGVTNCAVSNVHASALFCMDGGTNNIASASALAVLRMIFMP